MMSNFEATSNAKAGQEVWHVQFATGELRVMTLDQLDQAFQNGDVSEDTFVYQTGMNDWIKLGDLAGLDADDADEGPVSAARSQTSAEATVPQASLANTALGHSATFPSPFATSSSHPAFAVGPNSTAPFVSDSPDLEFDTDVPFRRRKGGLARWVLAAAALGGLGLIGLGSAAKGWVFKSESIPSGPSSLPVQAAMMAQPLPAAAAGPPAAAAGARDWPKTDGAGAQTAQLSDDTKKKLLDADKVRAEKARAHQRAAPPAAAPRRRTKMGSAPFHKGGNPHDPLNSSL